jgi:tetratricopeptide (TPR) repeat protein
VGKESDALIWLVESAVRMKFDRAVWKTLLKVLLTLGCAQLSSGQPQKKPAPQQQAQVSQKVSADQLLSLGDYYLRRNDITDAADRYYRQVVTNFPGSQQAGFAQYNRGSYWHRKSYLLRERKGSDREAHAALTEAEGQYYDYINRDAVRTNTIGLLADAEFNLALVYLQKNRPNDAIGWLNQLAYHDASRDPQVYIYRVVWSSNPTDVIDRKVDSAGLAKFTLSIASKGLSMDQLVSQVKQWCRKQ